MGGAGTLPIRYRFKLQRILFRSRYVCSFERRILFHGIFQRRCEVCYFCPVHSSVSFSFGLCFFQLSFKVRNLCMVLPFDCFPLFLCHCQLPLACSLALVEFALPCSELASKLCLDNLLLQVCHLLSDRKSETGADEVLLQAVAQAMWLWLVSTASYAQAPTETFSLLEHLW